MYFFFVFQIFLCVRVSIIINIIINVGEQYSNLPTEFARNAKRGAPKKQTGRPKNSEKALSKY